MVNLPPLRCRPRAVALDLDGTLLNSRGELSPRNRRAVAQALAAGLPVVIATSRAGRSVRRLIGPELTHVCSLVMLNGALARGAAPLRHAAGDHPRRRAGHRALIQQMAPFARLTIELEGFEFGCNMKLDAATIWQVNSATPDMVLPLVEALTRPPAKIVVNGLGRDLSAVAREIAARFGRAVSVVPTADMTFLNIPSARASKTAALRHLLRSQGIPLHSVAAFGDDLPDVELLAACGLSVAVANAAPEVRAAARYCTASNDDDGVAVVLERILEGPPRAG